MLAVHWSPVSNTKSILRNGITKSWNGLYCFPLTGHKSLDRWWVTFFNYCASRKRKKYNGFVFRLEEEDMPCFLGKWYFATLRDDIPKELPDLKTLGSVYHENLIWRMGHEIAEMNRIDLENMEPEKYSQFVIDLAKAEMEKSPKILVNKMADYKFMYNALDDSQIVLSHSIPRKRILKMLPQGDEFGRVLRKKKMYDSFEY